MRRPRRLSRPARSERRRSRGDTPWGSRSRRGTVRRRPSAVTTTTTRLRLRPWKKSKRPDSNVPVSLAGARRIAVVVGEAQPPGRNHSSGRVRSASTCTARPRPGGPRGADPVWMGDSLAGRRPGPMGRAPAPLDCPGRPCPLDCRAAPAPLDCPAAPARWAAPPTLPRWAAPPPCPYWTAPPPLPLLDCRSRVRRSSTASLDPHSGDGDEWGCVRAAATPYLDRWSSRVGGSPGFVDWQSGAAPPRGRRRLPSRG